MPFKVLLLAVISFVTVTTVFCASDETLEVLEGKTKTFKEQEASGDKSVSGIDSDTELLPGKDLSDEDEEKSEDIRFRSRGGFHRNRFPDYPDYGIIPHGTVRTRVTVQKRILRPRHRAPLPVPLAPAGVVHGNSGGFEGSYVAVSGRPGERTIHAVNGRGSVSSEYMKTTDVSHLYLRT